jgi:hypothetical protein
MGGRSPTCLQLLSALDQPRLPPSRTPGLLGVTQGDPLAMVIYGLALTPRLLDLSVVHPRVLQPWYADEAALEGHASDVAAAMARLARTGPARGYFPSPVKSIVLVRLAGQTASKSHLEAFQFRYQAGGRYLGSFLGDEGERDVWLAAKIYTWILALRILGKIAKRYPQTSYAGMTCSLQTEWQYTLHVIPDVEALFDSLAQVIVAEYLPALLSEPANLPEGVREGLTLPARWSGRGHPGPMPDRRSPPRSPTPSDKESGAMPRSTPPRPSRSPERPDCSATLPPRPPSTS